MVLGYTDGLGFDHAIPEEVKIHSLRRDPTRRWRPGLSIDHVLHNRSPRRRIFFRSTCTGTQEIRFQVEKGGEIRVYIDRRRKPLRPHEVVRLAINDGLETPGRMFSFFRRLIEASPDKSWTGVIVHWTSFRY